MLMSEWDFKAKSEEHEPSKVSEFVRILESIKAMADVFYGGEPTDA